MRRCWAPVLTAALIMGLSVGISLPAQAAANNGAPLAGFSIARDGTAAGGWIGSYQRNGKAIYRISPNASPGRGGWKTPVRRSSLPDVSTRSAQRAAWIVSRYGAALSDPAASKAQGAAVDAAVYALLRPGTMSLTSARARLRMAQSRHASSIEALAETLLELSAAQAGPYNISVEAPDSTVVDNPMTASVRVLSQAGKPVSGARVNVSLLGQEVSGVTNAQGTVPVILTPNQGAAATIAVSLSVPDWKLWVAAPRTEGQSRGILAGKRVTVTKSRPLMVRSKPSIPSMSGTTKVVGSSFDMRFTLSGGYASARLATVSLYGPYASASAANSAACSGAPFRSQTLSVSEDRQYQSAPHQLVTPGHYRWRVSVSADALNEPVTSACGATTWSATQPSLSVVRPVPIAFDLGARTGAIVNGLTAPYAGNLSMRLVGPFPSQNVSCSPAPSGSTTLAISANGTYALPTIPATAGGYYGAMASTPAGHLSFAANSPCTAIALQAKPAVSTLVSRGSVHHLGDQLSANWNLTGGVGTSRQATVRLYGPWLTAAGADSGACSSRQVMSATVGVGANGTYLTPSVTALGEGFYNWGVQVAGDAVNLPVARVCGGRVKVKTTPRTRAIAVQTVADKGALIRAKLRVTGLPSGYEGNVKLVLFGPFAQQANLHCRETKRYKSTSMTVKTDGTYALSSLRVGERGWYSWRAIVPASTLSDRAESVCAADVSRVRVR